MDLLVAGQDGHAVVDGLADQQTTTVSPAITLARVDERCVLTSLMFNCGMRGLRDGDTLKVMIAPFVSHVKGELVILWRRGGWKMVEMEAVKEKDDA